MPLSLPTAVPQPAALPTALPTTLPTASAEQHGLRSDAVLRLIDELEREGLDPHALVIARHGHVLFQGAWQPWSADGAALVYSVSKTFTALAIGLLEADGRIDLEHRVDRYLAEPNPHGVTVRHLLTMATGHSREQVAELPFEVRALLTTPPEHAPGSRFAYNSPASYALSRVVTAITGLSLTELLRDRLFRPLGIGPRWWAALDGLDQGFSGLHLTVEDLARIGIALADDGRFDGRQVIPEAFLEAATRPWSDTREPDGSGGSDGEAGDWSLGYGYQLWRSRHGFRLDGAYGQFSLIVPERGIVIAYQGATTRTSATLDALWRLVESFSDGPVEAPPADTTALARRAAALDSWNSRALLTAAPETVPDAAAWTVVDVGPDSWELTLPHGRVVARADGWQHAVLGADDRALAVAVRGLARDDGSVLLQVVVPTSPHRLLVVRDRGGVRADWHTAPLWDPSVDTLLVPGWVAGSR